MGFVFCSYRITGEIEKNLRGLGVIPVKLRGLGGFGGFHPIGYHPDMFCFDLGENRWLFYEGAYRENREAIDRLGLEVVTAKDQDVCIYPHDIGLNAAKVGDKIICNARHTDETILIYAKKAGKNIIDTKQGYAKCSVCVVDNNSLVTSDVSIYKKATEHKIEALLVEKGHIGLDGYGYGFIGGCSGIIGKNTLAFTGDISLHPNYGDIQSFCWGRGVEVVSLSGDKLYDYGSIFRIGEQS